MGAGRIIALVLALGGLGFGGYVANNALGIGERRATVLASADKALADAKALLAGRDDVAPEQRGQFELLMRNAEGRTQLARMMASNQQEAWMIAGGSGLAGLIALVFALRKPRGKQKDLAAAA